jgi:Tol biopolymer transport system component
MVLVDQPTEDLAPLRRLESGWPAGPRLNAYRPAWSPDGTEIIFNTNDTPERIEDAEIYIVASDGRGLRRLTHEENASAFRPTWSPAESVKVV